MTRVTAISDAARTIALLRNAIIQNFNSVSSYSIFLNAANRRTAQVRGIVFLINPWRLFVTRDFCPNTYAHMYVEL